jgi:glycosyltransferase involved in cell wall biosynthesis
VLTSDIPENREVVEGVGFIFRAGDVADLARMLDLLITHERIRTAAARLARDRVRDRYQWPRIAQEIGAVYEGLFGRSLAAPDQTMLEPFVETAEEASKRAA